MFQNEIAFLFSLLSGISFLIYGTLCFTSEYIKNDFERYGLGKLRLLTGILEILGGTGNLIGLFFNPIQILASAGLAILMICGMIARLSTKDKWHQFIPALCLCLMNIFIFMTKMKILSSF